MDACGLFLVEKLHSHPSQALGPRPPPLLQTGSHPRAAAVTLEVRS